MATLSRILAWRTPWTEAPGRGYSPRGWKEWDKTDQSTAKMFILFSIVIINIYEE